MGKLFINIFISQLLVVQLSWANPYPGVWVLYIYDSFLIAKKSKLIDCLF